MSYFLRNHWYVGAHSFELTTEKPIGRTICSEPMVLYRTAEGQAVALGDRCPHRQAPLSAGEVCGKAIACGYHGIQFGPDGECVKIPGDLPIPKNFRTRSFPVVERHGWTWIWMGEKKANPDLIPNYFENDDAKWTGVPGYLNIKCNYQLMVDNLLDLTHVVFVHKTTLAGGGVAETPLEVRVEGDRVYSQRMMHNVDTAPIYAKARGLTGKIDRWQIFEQEPPMYIKIILGAKDAGAQTPMGEPVHVVLNSLTPESENTIHYFWSVARPWALDDPKVSELYRSMIWEAFNEDKNIVEAQQRLIDSAPQSQPLVALPFDRAGNSARRILKRLIDEENGGGPQRAAAE